MAVAINCQNSLIPVKRQEKFMHVLFLFFISKATTPITTIITKIKNLLEIFQIFMLTQVHDYRL